MVPNYINSSSNPFLSLADLTVAVLETFTRSIQSRQFSKHSVASEFLETSRITLKLWKTKQKTVLKREKILKSENLKLSRSVNSIGLGTPRYATMLELQCWINHSAGATMLRLRCRWEFFVAQAHSSLPVADSVGNTTAVENLETYQKRFGVFGNWIGKLKRLPNWIGALAKISPGRCRVWFVSLHSKTWTIEL